MPLQPDFALLAGMAGSFLYFELLLTSHFVWRWGVPEAVRSTDQARLLFYVDQIAVAALMQALAAVVVAAWVQRLGALHGLFAAFVAGCLMTIAILGLNLAFGGTIEPAFAWQTFAFVVNSGAVLALPVALTAAGAAAGGGAAINRWACGGSRAISAGSHSVAFLQPSGMSRSIIKPTPQEITQLGVAAHPSWRQRDA